MMRTLSNLVAALLVVAMSGVAAQGGASARPLGPVVAQSSVALANVSQLVALRDGRVVVNDVRQRQLVLLDATLSNPRIILDSVAGKDHSYGPIAGTLSAFAGDSVLFHDPMTRAFLVIDANGKIARTMPRPPPGGILTQLPLSILFAPAFGIIQNLPVFPAAFTRRPADLRIAPEAGRVYFRFRDTSYVLALNVTTRAYDTLAKASTGRTLMRFFMANGEGGTADPGLLPFIDVPMVMSDGSVAIYRAGDNHLEWIAADRTHSSSPRIAYPWVRLSDDDRAKIVDSVNAGRRAVFDTLLAGWLADSAAGRLPVRQTTVMVSGVPTLRSYPTPKPVPKNPADIVEVPDYRPPTGADAVFADADNHVWIAPLLPAPPAGTRIFQIVDRSGAMVDRVQVPLGKSIVGFAPGFVFLVSFDGGAVTIEKVTIRSR